MLTKNYSKTGNYCRVTFRLPSEVDAESAAVCGEFNDWSPEANPLRALKAGGFSTTISLETGHSYRFRYLLDGERWENDWQADGYVRNHYGSEDSLVNLEQPPEDEAA